MQTLLGWVHLHRLQGPQRDLAESQRHRRQQSRRKEHQVLTTSRRTDLDHNQSLLPQYTLLIIPLWTMTSARTATRLTLSDSAIGRSAQDAKAIVMTMASAAMVWYAFSVKEMIREYSGAEELPSGM